MQEVTIMMLHTTFAPHHQPRRKPGKVDQKITLHKWKVAIKYVLLY
jgi:hypothetical protein